MEKKLKRALVLIGILCGAIFSTETLGAPGPTAPLSIDTNAVFPRLWQPVPDTVFLQEIGTRILTEKPVTSVAVHAGINYAVVSGKLMSISQGTLKDVTSAPNSIRRMKSLAGALWVTTDTGVYRLVTTSWQRIDERPFQDFCVHLGDVYGATRDDLFRFDGTRFV